MAVRPIDGNELMVEIQACNWDSDQDRERAEDLVLGMPTLTPPNEWVSVEDAAPDPGERVLATDGIFVGEAYRSSANIWFRHTGFPWRDGVTGRTVRFWMSLPAPPDKDNNVLAKTPNEPLTIEQLREINGEPIYVTTKNYGDGWCILNWHGVNKSYTYFSRTGTSEGMTATPLSAKTYGDLWLAYRPPPEGEEDT